MTTHQSICLGLIARDEEATIRRCINSCLPLVDRAVIIDTGSTDLTVEIAKDTLKDIPSTFLEGEWVGHAHNRSELLEKCRDSGADYTLMPDADLELLIEGELPVLDKDEYSIPVRDRGLVYPLPLLTSTRKNFFYAGVAHAYLACHDGDTENVQLDCLAFIDHGGGGRRPGKIEHDRDLLAAEVGKNPADARSWFYLAQSYRDLDQHEQAIAAYRMRASLGGWDEEVYQSLYQAGLLLSAHVNFYEAAELFLRAARLKPGRAEALRGLADCATAVANKIPAPSGETLFLEPGAYTCEPKPEQSPREIAQKRSSTALLSGNATSPIRIRSKHSLHVDQVSAVIVTRGNVDLGPTLNVLPFADIHVWDNSQRDEDLKTYGRVEALEECENDIVFSVDDDVIFTAFDELLAAYEPEMLVCNMDAAWVEGAGYGDWHHLTGAGSIYDRSVPLAAVERYLVEFPLDDEFLIWCDAIVGTLAPGKRVDLGYEVREFSDDPGRLWTTPGNPERKWAMINRCREMLVAA